MMQGHKHKHAPANQRRSDTATAFIPDPGDGRVRVKDDLADELAAEYLKSATSAEDSYSETLGDEAIEEEGGPFVITTGTEEFAGGADASNPIDAEREAFPRPNAGPDR